jgi:hypothetical protein
MKLKRTVLLAACVVTMGLMLVALFAPTAQAQQVTVEVNPGEPCNPAGDFSFETEEEAYVIDVLFKDNKTVEYGEETHSFFFTPGPGFFLGYLYFGSLLDAAGDVIPDTAFFGEFPSDADPAGLPAILDLSQPTVFSGMRFFAFDFNEDDEVEPGLPQSPFYSLSWVSTPPKVLLEGDPVTIGGTVTGLEGSGLVLQNNGADDLPIDSDGTFTFDTSLQPCRAYNVTVLTNPENPTQICNVENGSGDVSTEDVTDVAVTCVEPDLADIKKVAAEGDTLGGTVLKDILLSGGVSINQDGLVAFGGRDGNGNKAAFTQDGKVVAEGDTLEDNTILAAFRGQGEVAISSGQSGARVAFHGKAEAGFNDTDAVFTQAGKIAAVGDTISADTTVEDIDPIGKVAINNFSYQVAFHGKVEIDSGLSKERPHVVFIADGVETQVAAQEGSDLPDGTPLDTILDSGGVAINEWAEVAFHGYTADNVRAVFTQYEMIAKNGTDLLNGNVLGYIYDDGGVAINFFGEVAFHGYTSDGKAVFTQNGVVAKVGDFLDDGDPLKDIWTDGGVAINPYGPEVAFHGQIGTTEAVTDAVLVGQAPVADGEDTSGE